MTLNEIIQWAKDNDVDFDALVLIPHESAVDVHYLSTSARPGLGPDSKGLVIHIF